MATEADIAVPVCDTIREEGKDVVDQATNILANKLLQDEKILVDTPNEPPTIEGDNFLITPSIVEVHCEANSVLSDANKVPEKPLEKGILANEETCSKGIEQDAERVEAQLSKDTASDDCGINDFEVENLNVQVKTEDDSSFNISSDVSKEGECLNDQNTMTTEQEGFDNERNIAEKLDASADVNSQENITFVETIKGVDTKKEVLEDFSTVSNEEIEENSMFKVDASEIKNDEHVVKESEKTSSHLPLAKDAIDDESVVMHHEARIEEGEPREVESCEKTEDKTADAAEIKEEALQDVATIDSNQKLIQVDGSKMDDEANLEKEIKKTSLKGSSTDGADDESTIMQEAKIEDDCLTKVKASDVVLEEKTEDKTVDAAEIKEETLEDVATIDPNEKIEENLSIKVDGRKREHEANPEKETEKTSLKEASTDDPNDKSTIMQEAKIEDECLTNVKLSDTEKNIVSTPEDCRTLAASEDIETNSSLEEPSLPANPQEIVSDRTIDATETKDVTIENVATTVNQVDCSEMEHEEHLEKESGTSSLAAARKEEINDNKSKNVHEHEIRDQDVINAELLENEKHTASNLVKEEAQMEKFIDSSQIATKDVKECDSSQDTKVSSVEEQILTTDAQEVSSEKTFDAAKTKEETLEDIAADVPNNEDNSPIEEDGSQKPSLNDASTCNVNENESTIMHETKFVDQSSTKADLIDNENNAKDNLVKEDVSIESLQVGAEDIKAFASVQDGETSSLEEQSLTVNCEGTIGDHKEDETKDATSLEKEAPEDKNVATTLPCEDTKEKSLNQDDRSQMEPTQHLEEERENVKKGTSSVEEEHVDKPIDSLQVATEDIKESASGQDTDTGSVKEQIPTTEELLGENTEEKMIDPPHKNEETLENVATPIPHKDTQKNSFIEGDCLEKEHEEHLERESENPSVTEAATEETNEDKSISIHEPENKDEDIIKAELVKNEKYTASTVVKEEAPLKEPIDSSQVDTEAINEFDSCQDTKMRSITADPQGISSDMIEGKSIDATDTKEETLEDNATNVANGDSESPIEEDGSQKPHLEEDSKDNVNDDESSIKHEAKFVDESSTKADLFENEENTKDTSVKEEVSIESLHGAVAAEDIEAFTSVQDRETSSVEEQSLIVNCEGTISDDKEHERNDTTSMKEETPQDENVGTTTVYENTEKSLDQDDCSKMEQDEHLEKESEKNPSLVEAPMGDMEESTLVMKEAPMEKPIDSLKVANEDIEASASSQDTETSPINEQILTTEEILGVNTEEKAMDPPHTYEVTLENVATTVPHEDTQENSLIQVDCLEKEHEEHLEKESENLSRTKAATEETNEDESRNIHERKNRDDNVIKTELLESEKYTANTVVKEEALEEPIDSWQVETEVINESDSCQDTKTKSIEEQILTADPQQISSDMIEGKTINAAETKEETLEDIAANVPSADNEENSPIEEDGSQKPSLGKASTLNASEDELTIIHGAKYVDESSTKADLFKNEKNTEDTLVKEEVSIEPLQVAVENIKAFASVQEKETSSLEEQSITASGQGIIGEHNKDKRNDGIGMNKETPKDKNIAASIPYEDPEGHSLNQGNCSQVEQNEHLEKESEIPSLTEATTQKTNDSELKNIHELERVEPVENENCTVSTSSVKEVVHVEEPTNSLQIATEDIKAFDSGQDSSIEEQILITETKEISGDEIVEKAINAAGSKEDILEDVATNASNRDNEENSPIKEESSQKKSAKEASTSETNEDESTIMHEAKFVDESSIKADSSENEKNIGDTSVEEVSEDIKEFDSIQDIEMSSLKEKRQATDCQGIIGDDTEDQSADVTSGKEQTPGDENVSTTIPYEGKEEKSLEKDDCSQMEHHENESEIPSITEAPTRDTDKSTLIIKEAEVEKPIDSLEVAIESSEDIKVVTSSQDTETGSTVKQILTIDPQEIPCDRTEEKIVDAAQTDKEIVKNIATTISHKETMERTLAKEEAQAEQLIDSFQVASEDIKASTSSLDLETSSIEEQIQTAKPQEISGDNIEEKTIDAVCKEEETLEDVTTNVSSGDNEDRPQIKVDEPQVTSSEEVSTENATDNEPATTHQAKFADENLIKAELFENEKNTEDILEKEEISIEPMQVAVEDIKTSTSGQDRETSSAEEQSLTSNPQGITGDDKEDKTIDPAELKEEAPGDKSVAQEDTKENSIVQVDCSQMEHEEHFEKESENTSLAEAPTMKEEITEDTKPSQDTEISSTEETGLTEDPQEISEDTQQKIIDETETKEETLEVQEQGSDSSAIKIPDVNDDVVVDIAEDPNCKQDESSIPNVSSEHINISNESVAKVTSLVSEPLELNGDHTIVEEASSCSDTTDTEKIGVPNDVSITVPSNDNLVETEAKESTEAPDQVQNVEKQTVVVLQKPGEGTHEKEIEEELHISASQDGSEDIRNLECCREISESSDSVALEEVSASNMASEEVSTSNTFEESSREIEQDAVNEEVQKLFKDSSMENIDKDAQLESVHESDITQEMQKVEGGSVPSQDGKMREDIIEKTDCKESEAVENATEVKYIEHLEQDDATKSIVHVTEPTKSEQEETECRREEVMLDETVEEIKESTSIPVAQGFLPKSSKEPSEVEMEVKAADTTESMATNNNTSLVDDLTNTRSIVDLETKIADEAPEVVETISTAVEGQEVESRSVGEVLERQCEKEEYEHASIYSLTEKSDANEVESAHGENKKYDSKSQVVESISEVQSCDIISQAEEGKTHEENLETTVEANPEAEDKFEPKETMMVDISSKKVKEEDEDVESYHLGSLKEEVKQDEKITTEETVQVIKNANDIEKVSKVSEEAGDKAVVKQEEDLLANESIDRSLCQEEPGKSIEEFTAALDTEEIRGLEHVHIKTGTNEVNSSSEAFSADRDIIKGADGVDNELAKDEGSENQNSNTSLLDATAEEQLKRLDENIICEAASSKTDYKTIEEYEDKKENVNTSITEQQQQEEDNQSKQENLPLPEFAPEKESEKQDQGDEICSSHEVQAKDEENHMLLAGKSKEESDEADICSKPDQDEDRNTYVNPEKLELSSYTKDTSEVSHSDGAHDIPEDDENSTTIDEYFEEKYPNKSTEYQISTVSKDIELMEEGSKATSITAEMQETVARSYSGVVPEQTGVDSRQAEEVSECKGVTETSTSIQSSKISTLDCKVETSLESEDQLSKLHDLPQESHVLGSEVKMAQRDGLVDLQKVTDVSEDVPKLKEGCADVSNKQNLLEANQNDSIEAMISSEGQEAEEIQKTTASETFEAKLEEPPPGRTFEVVTKAKAANAEEEKTPDNECSDLIEKPCRAVTEMVSKSNTQQSSMDDTAQNDENKESQQQTILVATSLPAKDKHAILEVDHTKNVSPENSLGDKNIVIQHGSSAEYSQGEGEGEISEPSKHEQEEAHCGHEEIASQETTKSSDKFESKETYKSSLSNLLQVSMKESSEMAVVEKEPILTENQREEKTDEAELEDTKTDEEKNDEEESSEQRRLDLGSEAPVMVYVGDADVKVTHKKSHNILSGVGSKVKHSIAKVKKAITGKSSHPKPLSPKEGDKY